MRGLYCSKNRVQFFRSEVSVHSNKNCSNTRVKIDPSFKCPLPGIILAVHERLNQVRSWCGTDKRGGCRPASCELCTTTVDGYTTDVITSSSVIVSATR